MTEINLRTYIQEIDDLIEEGQQLEEAIAHCRHILKAYPKHMDTYRLLGKAYLESKRFGDAGDIFQRVLSAIPNDFVSHVGMAIIREDEGNLDAAIWHMERGSEAQPGNAAIEEELKRLVGKRDGIEPQRVRPTRGALARMYYHGELYSYAVSELQTALEEDPDRPDLQLLLADTFWRTDKRLEAADLCRQILEKLPYCFLANQITAALLQSSGKPEESAINLRRLIALDPYMAYIESPMDSPQLIEASVIQLEKLAWRPGQPLPSSEAAQPDWAASLGVDLRGDEAKAADQEAMPSWLKSPPSPTQEAAPEEVSPIHPFAGAKPPPGADIPEWMREAGWVETSGEATEGPSELAEIPESEEDLPSPDRPLADADLPSWLSEISPERVIQEEAAPISEPTSPESRITPEMEESQDLPDWIQEITPPEVEEEPEPLELASEEEPELGIPSLEAEPLEPEFLGEVEAPGIEDILAEQEPIEEEIPEYPPWLEPSTPGATDTIVTWLGDKSLEETTTAEDIPTWMRGTGPLEDPSRRKRVIPEQEPAEEPVSQPLPAEEDMTAISEDLEEPVPIEELPTSTIQPDEPTPDWLEEDIEIQEELVPEETDLSEVAPSWLEEETAEAEEVPAIEEATTPSWLEELDEEFEEEALEGPLEPEEAFEASERPPDWLSEVIQEDILDDGERVEEKPDWLVGVVDAESILEEEAIEDLEEAPEWLSEISQVEEVDTSPITEDLEEPPEWLKGLSDTEIPLAEEEIAVEEMPPDWVTQESFPETEEEIVSAQETPEWLQELTEPPSMVEEPSDISVETPTVVTAAEDQPMPVPELEETPVEEEPILEQPVSEMPEPFEEEEILVTTEETIGLEKVEEEPISDEFMIEEPTEEEPTPSAEITAIPAEEAPDWLQDMITTTEEEAAVEEPSQVIDESFPGEEIQAEPDAIDWLKEITETPSQIEPSAEEVTEKILEPAPSETTFPADEAPVWIEETEEIESEAVQTLEDAIPEPSPPVEEEVSLEEAPDWLQEFSEAPSDIEIEVHEELEVLPEDIIPSEPMDTAVPSEIAEEVVDEAPAVDEAILLEQEEIERQKEISLEDTLESEALPQETPDWLQEIELRAEEAVTIPSEDIEQIEELTTEAGLVAGDIEEEPLWQPEFTKEEIETGVTPEPIEEIEAEAPKSAFEESLDWLQESALEVTPEPELAPQELEPSFTREQIEDLVASVEDPLDDDEVFSFLDNLAAREAVSEAEAPPEELGLAESTIITGEAEEKLIEEHALPEELDESLDWLEQLAGEEPVEDFSPPIFVEEFDDEGEAEIPEWLEEVAEKVDQIPVEDKIGSPKEITEEPLPPTPELSTMETIISKRPKEEEIPHEEPLVEHPEEKLTEPLPSDTFTEEPSEGLWTLEVEEKTPLGIEAPPTIPEPELPTEKTPEVKPVAAIEKVTPEVADQKEDITLPEEAPTIAPHAAKLNEARRALESGQIEEALGHYSGLIEEKAEMTAVIQDLRNAIEKTPREPMLWQILGDALMNIGQLSDAIDAYRRGMEAV